MGDIIPSLALSSEGSKPLPMFLERLLMRWITGLGAEVVSDE